jgi:hypothetical protein
MSFFQVITGLLRCDGNGFFADAKMMTGYNRIVMPLLPKCYV